jgi:selenocysteine-specific elongation factor
MKNIVVGTAGHIDHGKTSLIKALTGFDGDTLKEEKERGITIDLSFSNLASNDTNIAFIDVPGHEKLIKNMIAGAFGFDASLVVVDAKEGLMEQTKEHLAILNSLKISNIIVALTKADLVDKTTLEKQQESIKSYIKELKELKLLHILPTSIYDQNSIDKLKEALFMLPKINHKKSSLFRYYVDRSFSIKGIGSVVTGTVIDGEVSVGDKVFISELNTQAVIRNIQVHEKDREKATISQRAALNLQNIKQPIKKGYLLTKKGYIRGFNSVDIYFESILDKELKHNQIVNLHIGSKVVEGKVLLYSAQESAKADFAKIELKESIFAIFNEALIITANGRVAAGANVLNAINEPLKKRKKLPLLQALKEKDFKSAFEILIQSHKKGFGLISSYQRFGLSHQEAIDIAKEIKDIFIDEKNLVIYPLKTKELVIDLIKNIYTKNQYALLSTKSLESRLHWASSELILLCLEELTDSCFLTKSGNIYKKSDIKIDNFETIIEDKIYSILQNDGISPQAPYNIYEMLDIDKTLGDNALKELTKSKKVIRLAHNLFITSTNLTNLIKELKAIIKQNGYIDIATFKKHYQLSRKYMVAYLEYLDNFSEIKKEGNRRYM